jgi:acyl carrier protein
LATPVELSAEKVEALVNKIMVDIFEAREEDLKRESLLGKDLNLDSLDGVDLVIALEKTFGCKIGEQEARGIRTLGDIYDKVLARTKAAERA